MKESTKPILSIISVILFLFMLNSVRNLCEPGCLKCLGNNICGICDTTNLYVLLNGRCLKQDLEFCLMAFNLRTCGVCYPGFYLEMSGKCVRNPQGINEIANCKEYASFTRCKTCHSKFYIANNGSYCERVENNFIENCEIYESETKCAVCSDSILSFDQSRCDEIRHESENCMLYSDEYECTECFEGYYKDKNKYLDEIDDNFIQIVTGFFTYLNSKHSVMNMPVCKQKTEIKRCKIPLGNHKCQECEDGYHINSNFNECIQNPDPTVFFRTDDISNCYLHNKTIVKRNNEDVLNVECILCFENYFKTVNNRKCVKHSSVINNCKVMSQSLDNLCILCESGYYRKDEGDEQCIQREDIADNNCQKYHSLSEVCETCEPDFPIKHYNEKVCSAKIDKCKTYEISGKILACKQCDFGYYFDTTVRQCISNDTFDPYCSFYDQNKQCLECSFGFYYDTTLETPMCQPNTPEYVAIARCTQFDSIKKDLCIGCNSSSKTIKLEYTCKGYDYTENYFTSATTDLPYCEQTEINEAGVVTCVQPLDEVIDDDENNKKLFVLFFSESKAYDYTDQKIPYCNKHQLYYKSKNEAILCEECYASRSIERTFTYNDLTNLDNCSETERDSGYCVKFYSSINTCRTHTYTNINTNKCNPDTITVNTGFGNIQVPSSIRCPIGCPQNSNECTVNNCNIDIYDSQFTCSSTDGNGNCNIYHFFQSGTGVTFKESLENEIIISPDRKSCLIYYEAEFEANNGCVQSSEDKTYCLLCKKGFYSIPTKNFSYELDSIESYVSKTSVTGFVLGCIRFNKIKDSCERCTDGKYIFRNECVSCDETNFAKDSTNLNCVQYVDAQFGNTCEQISVLESVTYCIKCKNSYVSKIDWNPDLVLFKSFYPKIDGDQSLIQLSTQTSKITSCSDSNNLFYYKKEFQETLNNCLFYSTYNEVDYCLGCKFGFTGEVYRTPNDFLSVQGCQTDPLCDLTNTFPLDVPSVANLITCHECVDKSTIPTFTFFYTSSKNGLEAEFLYEPNNTGKKTMECVAPIIPNCLVQFKTYDDHMKNLWGSRDTVCAYCKPKYTPTYLATNLDSFPYKFATQCTEITECAFSLTPNICEECNSSNESNKMNLVTDNSGMTSCVSNSYIEIDPFCKTTLSSSVEGICNECKNGYVSLNFKCVALNITSCKRFWKDTCADSDKELGEDKSILWREYNSDYVINTINCAEISNAITNCQYYIDETTCHQCSTDYFVGNNGKACYQRNIDFCLEYNDVEMNCSKCSSGYSLTSAGVCTISSNENLRGCSEYSDGFCSKCLTEGFSPVKINSNQTSICLNSTFSYFCETIDETKLLNEKILTCTKCKKMNDFENLATENDFTITNYDFAVNSINNYADIQGINKGSELFSLYEPLQTKIKDIYSPQDLRFSLYKYDFEICQEFTSIDNCLKYDDSTFENSFKCIQCTNDYYLNESTGACQQRTIIEFCLEYNINSNSCKTLINDNSYSIELSTFDNYVIINNPPENSNSNEVISGIENCVGYSDTNTCTECNSSTYLYDNLCLIVQNIVAECETYEKDGLCKKCKENLILFQNKCLPIYINNCSNYLSNTECYRCPNQFPYLSNGSCIKNPLVSECDEYSNLNSCRYCTENYFKTNDNLCKLEPDYIYDCLKHRTGPFCLKCKENYVLQNNQCIYKPYFDPYCKTYKSVSKCSICRFNHYFKENQCYSCQTDPFTCYFCHPDNPSKCIVCKSGFFMNDNFECLRITDFTQAMIRLHQENLTSKHVNTIKFELIAIFCILLNYI